MFIEIYFIIIIFLVCNNIKKYTLVIFTTFIFNANISARKKYIQLFVYQSLLKITKKFVDIKILIYFDNLSMPIINNSKNLIICKTPKLNNYGTPYFGYLFYHAIKLYESKFYMFVNGDIIISPNIRSIIISIIKFMNNHILKKNILCVATRSSISFNICNINKNYNHYKLYTLGIKSCPYSQDVFIMTKSIYKFYYELYNKLLIGRAGIDNIILGKAINNKMIDVIDATDSISPIHLEDCKSCKKNFVSVL